MVDALVSGTSVSDDVKVRVLSWAPKTPLDGSLAGFRFIRVRAVSAFVAELISGGIWCRVCLNDGVPLSVVKASLYFESTARINFEYNRSPWYKNTRNGNAVPRIYASRRYQRIAGYPVAGRAGAGCSLLPPSVFVSSSKIGDDLVGVVDLLGFHLFEVYACGLLGSVSESLADDGHGDPFPSCAAGPSMSCHVEG